MIGSAKVYKMVEMENSVVKFVVSLIYISCTLL